MMTHKHLLGPGLRCNLDKFCITSETREVETKIIWVLFSGNNFQKLSAASQKGLQRTSEVFFKYFKTECCSNKDLDEKLGDGIAQKKRLRFPPRCPRFESWHSWNFLTIEIASAVIWDNRQCNFDSGCHSNPKKLDEKWPQRLIRVEKVFFFKPTTFLFRKLLDKTKSIFSPKNKTFKQNHFQLLVQNGSDDFLYPNHCVAEAGYLADKGGPTATYREYSILGSW